jgi:lipoprotein NlpI
VAEAALAANPDSAPNHNNFGIALLYDGEPEAAREAFLTALELDGQLAGALYNLAIVETYYFYDLDKGREWFSRYAELDTEDPDELGAVFGIELAANAASQWTEPQTGGESDAQ